MINIFLHDLYGVEGKNLRFFPSTPCKSCKNIFILLMKKFWMTHEYRTYVHFRQTLKTLTNHALNLHI